MKECNGTSIRVRVRGSNIKGSNETEAQDRLIEIGVEEERIQVITHT